MAPRIAARRAQKTIYLAYFYSAPLAWFCSAVDTIMMTLLGKRMGGLGEGLQGFVQVQLTKTLDYIASGLEDGPFLMGPRLTLADIQMSYMLALAEMSGALDGYTTIVAYLDRLREQPGFQRATERGGPMTPPRRA